MADALLRFFRRSLPEELASISEPYLTKLEQGEYQALLEDPEAQKILNVSDEVSQNSQLLWNDAIFARLGALLSDRTNANKQAIHFCIGYAAFLAFLQCGVTGPPLEFDPTDLVLGKDRLSATGQPRAFREDLLQSLNSDGIAPYKLVPHVELLCLAEAVMTCPPILKNIKAARWAKARIGFVHQRLLSEASSTLQDVIYDDLGLVDDEIFSGPTSSAMDEDSRAEFLLERATIHNFHGLDRLSRQDIEEAKRSRRFEFALTGLLGKRTKFQQKDISQLVVLAKSQSDGSSSTDATREPEIPESDHPNGTTSTDHSTAGPKNLSLDDDTLLEAISFTQQPTDSTQIVQESALPPVLAKLDPGSQPQLHALDSTILLSLASSITNTSPTDGLTREETLPYATRVLDGGSSNWQIYTQALLVRSRIEGYKSRTLERGLLQLQVLVDQVIAETTGTVSASADSSDAPSRTTFLPKATGSEAASVAERLRYIFQLASPTRWELEAELAARWTSVGGLRSALDIYERLEMWAEAALCWAATDREDRACKIVRRQLFHATDGGKDLLEQDVGEDETWSGPPREPPPSDAPRLYCILGDIKQSPEMYEAAWTVSKQRYARAQRSLGRYYLAQKDYVRAAEAYSKSLKANQLHHGSWFALGCTLLELGQYEKAAEAFSRCVQLDETDAESWSNLAAALLRKDPDDPAHEAGSGTAAEVADDEDVSVAERPSARSAAQKQRQDALKALKRAAALKHDSFRIWENVLIVSASVSPPDDASMLAAQKRIIDLRGSTDGEKCVDFDVLNLLVQRVIAMSDVYDPSKPGLQRMCVKFVDEDVVPLITGSAKLWQLVGRLALWRGKPSSALDAEEKAWRAITSQPGWETEDEARWAQVVEATIRLCDSYESLGPRERTEGMGSGTPVAKDWKFKARSAVRGIMGRGKATWDGTEGWDRLKAALDDLKG